MSLLQCSKQVVALLALEFAVCQHCLGAASRFGRCVERLPAVVPIARQFEFQWSRLCPDNRPFDEILQFAYVARPVVALKGLDVSAFEPKRRSTQAPTGLL